MDVVDRQTRSRMMAGIRGKNTIPELVIRKGLHRNGFRFRLHVPNLAGRPDIVLPKYGAVVFVNGCFWHAHNGCRYFKLPSTRVEFWQTKLEKNIQNDARAISALVSSGWRVAVVWECAIKGKKDEPLRCLIDSLSAWIRSAPIASVMEFTNQGGPFPADLG